MAKSKYVDTTAVVNVLAGVYTNPSLLDNENYYFTEEDFSDNDFHETLFGAIFNLHALGATEITVNTIEDYLEQRPKRKGIYQANNGAEYLKQLSECAKPATFQYYYDRLKKFTLLRMYDTKCGMDLSWLYDMDNILDSKKRQYQEDRLDNTSLQGIAELIDKKIEDIKLIYVNNCEAEVIQAGKGIDLLLDSLKKSPDIGYPMYGKYINTIFRGARLGKFYARSAATNVGKTRAMIGDASYIGCGTMYDKNLKEWINTGEPQPTLFIATEQSLQEVQQMMLAFLADVNEEHIAIASYEEGEEDRVMFAAEILKNSKMYFEEIPDFTLQDVENVIKKGIREYDIKYIFFDYLQTSISILEEITRRSGGIKIREDNVLYMMSTKLKDICTKYDVFIMTSTQLNAGYQDAEVYDQNLLRGAKAIADKLDGGSIMLELSKKDEEALADICKRGGYTMPNVKMSIYKNRATKWKNILVWINADKGTCRFDPIFITDYNYKLIEMEDFKICVRKSVDISAF